MGETNKVIPRIQGPTRSVSFMYFPSIHLSAPHTMGDLYWGEEREREIERDREKGFVLTQHSFPQVYVSHLSPSFPSGGSWEDNSSFNQTFSKVFVFTSLRVTTPRFIFILNSLTSRKQPRICLALGQFLHLKITYNV